MKTMRLPSLVLAATALAGCSVFAPPKNRPRPHVTGIAETRASAGRVQGSVAQAQASSAQASAEIAHLKSLAARSEGKSDLILKWLDYQDRKEHSRAQPAP
jgi:hypothetical protein